MTRACTLTDEALIHVDDAIVAVNKPSGPACAAGRAGEITVIELLRALPRFANDEPLRIVQRLDREASGVLIYARTLEAQRLLTEQFAAGRVEKVYHALVSGYAVDDGQIDLPIKPSRRGTNVMCATAKSGKPARTRYRVLERMPGITLLECRPQTGRTHQIRVHLSAVGLPLAIDPIYGSGTPLMLSKYKSGYRPSRRHEERPLIERLTLHAVSISFLHPADGRRVTYAASYPKDFRTALTQLRRLA